MLLRRALTHGPQRARCACPAPLQLPRRCLHASVAFHQRKKGEEDAAVTQRVAKSRKVRDELAEALADLNAMVDGSSPTGSGGAGDLVDGAAGRSAVDEHSGGDELVKLLAMVHQREQSEEAAAGAGAAGEHEDGWGGGAAADLTDSSRDAFGTSKRKKANAELVASLKQEEIEDARARYNKKKWARNWVVKRTTELHRRRADAAEVEQAIQEMVNRGDLPTVVTYNVLISACGRPPNGAVAHSVRPSDAKRAYKGYVEMKRRGLVPTAATYSALLTTLGRVNERDRSQAQRRRGKSAAAARIEAAGAGGEGDLFERAWEGMAGYLSDHARGLVVVGERDRSVLCNAALNAAMRKGDAGRGKVAQIRDYTQTHAVRLDAVGYTLLVKSAKQALDEAVQATISAAKRANSKATTASAAAAERDGAIALRNLLTLWMELGAAEIEARSPGTDGDTLLDGRLVNGLLAALGSAARLIEVDPLALTTTTISASTYSGPASADSAATAAAAAAATEGFNRDSDVAFEFEYDYSGDTVDFGAAHDVDDVANYGDTFDVEEDEVGDDEADGEVHPDGDEKKEEEEEDEYAGIYEEPEPEERTWTPPPGLGELRRARQQQAIVSMSWSLWESLQTNLEVRAAKRERSDGSKRSKRIKMEEAEDAGSMTHVLSTLTSVMLRAGTENDRAAALHAVLKHPHVKQDGIFWAVLMEEHAERGAAAEAEMLMDSLHAAAAEGGQELGGLTVGTRHFNALLRAFARTGGEWASDKVWPVLHTMRNDLGIDPDEYTISILLTACDSAENSDKAMEVLQMALLLAGGRVKNRVSGQKGQLRPTMTLLRHAHRVFNRRWGWRRRPEALAILWKLWALGASDQGGEPVVGGGEFPWWDSVDESDPRRPNTAGPGVGARVATVRAAQKNRGTDASTGTKSGYKRVDDGSSVEVDEVAVERLLRKRDVARSRRDWETADKLLVRLLQKEGVVVSDDDRVWAAAEAVADDRPATAEAAAQAFRGLQRQPRGAHAGEPSPGSSARSAQGGGGAVAAKRARAMARLESLGRGRHVEQKHADNFRRDRSWSR